MAIPPTEIKLIKIGTVFAILLFVFGTLSIYIIRRNSLEKSFIETSESILQVNLSDTNPFIVAIKFILGTFGVLLMWVWGWTLLNFVLGGGLMSMVYSHKKKTDISKMRGHYIICGAGRTGQVISEILERAGKRFVFLDKDPKVTEILEERYRVVLGDATEEADLKRAGINRAAGLFAVTNSDPDNLVIVIVGNEIRPKLPIYARASTSKFIQRMKKAGAKAVVSPETVSGEHLAKSMLGHV